MSHTTTLDQTAVSARSQPLRESAELEMVRDAARSLLDAEWPSQQAAALAVRPEELQRLWRHAVRQGWTQLDLHDRELGLAAALVLQQELGRAECPIPLADAVLCDAVLAGASGPAAVSLRAALHEGDLVPTWCFGPGCGEADAYELVDAGSTLNARLSFVENTAVATHLFVVTGREREVLVVPMSTASIRATTGLARPALAEVMLVGADRFERIDTSFDLTGLPTQARLLLAARALGATRHGLDLLCDYARVRTQFGQKIGQFQGPCQLNAVLAK